MKWYWMVGFAVLLLLIVVSRRGESGKPRLPDADDLGARATDEDIDALIRAGRKIEAIKAYRHVHHVDLKDAKDAIETRARSLTGGR
jgi:ribosomal protein L7/L12